MIKLKNVFWLLAFILFVLPYSLLGFDASQMSFEHLFRDTELSKTRINCIYQGNRGYLWFGTQVGLYKYDGYSLKAYRSNPADTNSISGNDIRDIEGDGNGNLWIATYGGGLNSFDKTTGFFTSYLTGEQENSIHENYINALTIDENGFIWLGYRLKGLGRLNPESGVFQSFTPISDKEIENGITEVYCDSDNSIWFGGYINGLYRVVKNEKISFVHYKHEENNKYSLSDNDVWSIYEDSQNNLWIGANTLNKYNKENDNFLRYPFTEHDGTRILSIYQDKNKKDLWLGTGIGIVYGEIIDGETIKFHTFRNNDPESSLGLSTYTIYQDKAGNVWAGGAKGIVKGKPIVFNHYQPEDVAQKQQVDIVSIAEDETGNVWVSSWGQGIYRYKVNSEVKTNLAKLEKVPGDFRQVWKIYPVDNGLMIGSWGKGLGKIITSDKKYNTKWFELAGHTNIIVDIQKSSDSNIWIGGWSSEWVPLYLFNPATYEFKYFSWGYAHGVPVNDILEDGSGNLWLATQGYGLFKIIDVYADNKSRQILNFTYNPDKLNSISDDIVNTIYEDENGIIWVGTENGGLCSFTKEADEPEGYSIKNYTAEDGLPDNHIMSITGNGANELWFSTRNGLAKYDMQDSTFFIFTDEDGLPGNEFNVRSFWKTPDNRLYFGGKEGFTVFYPDSVMASEFIPNVVIDGFYLFNQKIEPHDKTEDGRVLLSKSIHETDEVVLNYQENIISFEFASLDFTNPKRNKYMYHLFGFDKQWHHTTGKRRYITYTNLEPGEYTFQVKGANSDGIWNQKPASLKIVITPPYWQTVWFKLVVIIFILLSVYLWHLLRVYNLKFVNKRLEQKVKERTEKIDQQRQAIVKINNELLDERNKILFQSKKLHQQNEDLKNANAQLENGREIIEKKNALLLHQKEEIEQMVREKDNINQMKLKFFTNISHEFRTPLTLISSPLKKLLKENSENKELYNQLVIINKNAEKLLRMVNQLIDFRRLEAGKIQLRVKQDNINQVSQEAFDSFQEHAKQHGIKYSFQSLLQNSIYCFDREKVDMILYNLLSNAFKYTSEGGKIGLTLTLESDASKIPGYNQNGENTSYLKVVVSDTGIGIPGSKIGKIFERFYLAHEDKEQNTGTGIGLALVNDLVELHRGTIHVDSVVQGEEMQGQESGTCFTIWLPAEKAAYSQEEIICYQDLDEQVMRNETSFFHPSPLEIKKQRLGEKDNTGFKILIVEDNLDLLEYLIDFFSGAFNVYSAANGLEGYEKAIEIQPDVIVSDIMMPKMDGIELCKKIKENKNTSHIPIILLTAKSAIEHRVEGLSMGADSYIPKPFDPNHLEIRVNKLIESRKELIEKFSKQVLLGPDKIEIKHADELFLNELMDKIDKNLNKENFNIDFLASEMNMSRRQLYRKLEAVTSISAGDLIRNFRIQKAAQLLKQSGLSVSQIAYEVGFKSPKHFSKSFKDFYGLTPSEYQKKN